MTAPVRTRVKAVPRSGWMKIRKPNQLRQHDRQLGELGGLEAQDPQADPAVRLVHRIQEEHHDQTDRGDGNHRVDDPWTTERAVVEP